MRRHSKTGVGIVTVDRWAPVQPVLRPGVVVNRAHSMQCSWTDA